MIVVIPPIVEPLTLPQAKLHLRFITDPADVSAHPLDGEVQGWISAARQKAEEFCSRPFSAASYEARGAWFDVALLKTLTEITVVKYLDVAGAQQTLPDTVYELNGDREAPRLQLKIGQEWPAIYSRADAVRVTFKDTVPFLAQAAMLLIVGSFNLNREEVSAAQTFALPMRVQDLLWPYRVGLGV